MTIPISTISSTERDKILGLHESHFCDLKGIAIQPAKLTRTISAFSNAEGGEVYLGVAEDKSTRLNIWNGFNVPEDANGHLQAFEALFPLGVRQVRLSTGAWTLSPALGF
jgi:ATP-dependent DNA helicase RecG